MVFDNFVLNLKSMIRNDKCGDIYGTNSGAIEGNSVLFKTRVTPVFGGNLFSNVRTLFNGRYAAVNKNCDDDLMFPRVYSEAGDYGNAWDPIDFKTKEKVVEELDNVIDKFIRVISVSGDGSPAMRGMCFDVGAHFCCYFCFHVKSSFDMLLVQ